MRKPLLSLAFLAVSSTTLPCLAYNDPGAIFSIGVGGSKASMTGFKTSYGTSIKPTFKLAPVYDAELSYRFNRFCRAGINAQYRVIRMSTPDNFQLASGATINPGPAQSKSLNVLLNGYLELDNYTRFTPYVMAGVGFGNISFKETVTGKDGSNNINTSLKASQSGMCFGAGAGVQVQLAYDMGLDFSYRFMRLGKLSLPNYLKATSANPSTVPINKHVPLNAHEFLVSFFILLGSGGN